MPREPRPMQSVIDQIDSAVKELRQETKKGASPEVFGSTCSESSPQPQPGYGRWTRTTPARTN